LIIQSVYAEVGFMFVGFCVAGIIPWSPCVWLGPGWPPAWKACAGNLKVVREDVCSVMETKYLMISLGIQ